MIRCRLKAALALCLGLVCCLAPWPLAAQTAGATRTELGLVLGLDAAADATHAQAAVDAAELLLSVLPDATDVTVVRSFPRLQHTGALQANWPAGSLLRRLNASRPLSGGDSAALGLAWESFSRGTEARRVLLALLPANPPKPDELLVDAFIEQGARLVAISPEASPLSDTWTEAVVATGGSVFTYTSPDTLILALLRAFLESVKPQMLEIGGVNFQVDNVSSRVTVLARRDESQPTTLLLGPENRRVNIRKGKNYPNDPDLDVSFVGPLMVLHLDKPQAGLWGLRGVHAQDMVVLTRSRQRLHLNLPRKRALQSEFLPISAYMVRDGSVVKLISEDEQIGFFATLVDEQGLRAASVPLLDNGTFPDFIAGDGIFTASLPLAGLRGDYVLWVVARTEQASRTLTDRITVLPGDWVTVRQPETPLLPGESGEFSLEFSPALPFHRDTRIRVTFDGQDPQLRPDPINRLGFHVTLAIRPEDLSRRKTLTITRTVPYDDLITDVQTLRVPVDIAEAPKTAPVVILLVALLIGVNLAGLAVWLIARRRRNAPPEPEEEEEEPEPAPEPRRVPKKPPKPSMPLDEPITESVTFESVTDRLSEVAAVHRGETVRADIERVELHHEDLDRDGDPEFAMGTAFDSTDQWGQRIEPSSSVDIPNEMLDPVATVEQQPERSPFEDSFERLSGADMSDIFDAVWNDSRINEPNPPLPRAEFDPSENEEPASAFLSRDEGPTMEEDMLFESEGVEVRAEESGPDDDRVLGLSELEELIAQQQRLMKKSPSEQED